MGEMRGDRSIKSCSSYPLADRGNPYKPPLFLLLKKAPSRPHPPERRGRVSEEDPLEKEMATHSSTPA